MKPFLEWLETMIAPDVNEIMEKSRAEPVSGKLYAERFLVSEK